MKIWSTGDVYTPNVLAVRLLLAAANLEWNNRCVIFKLIFAIDGRCIPYRIALRWMSLDRTAEKSTMVQIIFTWANVDTYQCRHMASLGRNELIIKLSFIFQYSVLYRVVKLYLPPTQEHKCMA